MAKLNLLHERTFAGKPLKSFRLYDDPFGEKEVCVELIFLDGQVEYVAIGSGRPAIVGSGLGYEAESVSPPEREFLLTAQPKLESHPVMCSPANG